jgi:hypothetical protein
MVLQLDAWTLRPLSCHLGLVFGCSEIIMHVSFLHLPVLWFYRQCPMHGFAAHLGLAIPYWRALCGITPCLSLNLPGLQPCYWCLWIPLISQYFLYGTLIFLQSWIERTIDLPQNFLTNNSIFWSLKLILKRSPFFLW